MHGMYKRMKDNIIEVKAFSFAVRIVALRKYLVNEKSEYELSKQVLRSGTSIGANVTEAQNAQSISDFISKLSIAQKETSETDYWLRLLHETDYISDKLYNSLIEDCRELYKLLSSIILSSKSRL